MKLSDIPAKFTLPFANNATAGHIRTIPVTPTGVIGQASLTEGFPPANFTPVASGGVPPFGQDFNGLHNQESAWNRWQATGMFPPYDPTWQAAVGGYPQGSIVQSLQRFGLFWLCLVDDNTTDPDTGGAGWYAWSSILTQNVDIYVNPSTGSDTLYNGSSPTVSGNNGPYATLTKALAVVSTFAPNTFGATINLAAGTYNGGGTGFASSNFAHCNVTITGAGATSVITSSGGQTTLLIQGPNNYKLQNFSIGSTSTFANGAILLANTGGATTTLAGGITCNSFTSAPVPSFIKCGQGTVVIAGSITIAGTMGYSGNYGSYFVSSGGGSNTVFGGSAVITISSAVTCAYFVQAFNAGLITVTSPGAPSFVNPGNVTGQRYVAVFNSIINTQGQGANYFPGSVAGSTSTGGQYA